MTSKEGLLADVFNLYETLEDFLDETGQLFEMLRDNSDSFEEAEEWFHELRDRLREMTE